MCHKGVGPQDSGSARGVVGDPVADPDLELRGAGGAGVLIYLPSWLFSLLSFLFFFFFLPKISGGIPWASPLDPPLYRIVEIGYEKGVASKTQCYD